MRGQTRYDGGERTNARVGLACFGLVMAVLTVLIAACASTPPATHPSPTGTADATTKGQGRTRPAKSATARPTTAGFDKHAYSVTNAGSLWVIVNKKHPLKPLKYRPKLTVVDGRQVDRRMAPALRQLLAGSLKAKRHLHVVSGYRSYDYQRTVFHGLAAQQGRSAAEKWSAKPGYSEHQTGLAVDLDLAYSTKCSLQSCFGNTEGGRWLAANAWRYGFVIRYTAADKAVTGYSAEPWHIRYVGKPLAAELHRTHATCLETFFGVTGGA
ncbi:hypothetical protein GCM10011575_36190 [Microlunatus endophyticus]|uniref:D-alanyl-D-alanine carboxypeptidase-like core domain-containing protein n=1 Tax=Microlunatus endophyticus TaxID=1716077 RepID=A0A917SFD1_9ACTN|nr:M15 family metallopeptidase [Microlunatus endophyticus]GGL74743.1 hypothetical protein GCM10011575_36190 [Microlunatus endophyticus]